MLDIMLPFWGEPRYLYETVEAVRRQTDSRWRLTVVDDCYPDPAVSEHFENLDDPRIVYTRNETNLGITANYAHCLELATSDLVVLLGCDDIPMSDYVARVLDDHDRFPHADIIQPGVRIIDSQGRRIKPLVDAVKRMTTPRARSRRLLGGEDLAASLLRADWLYWPSLVFKRETLASTPFRPGFPIIQDLALVIDIIAAGGTLLLDPHPCFNYRRHEESASSSALLDGQRFSGEQKYFALAQRLMLRNGWTRAARAARMHSTSRAHALALLPVAVRRRDRAAARMLAAHALRR
ncbi:glycosyltransferase family 2 protein [uncultured Actinomyces sp.]|uniref:glycosyltransferase family 2 protein n=1 Tax=uncultured Actinomyces sp. TaxID=249061 RepID=UPI00288AD1DE|nr:glycosyltransferase family 2 protein [uncultured Actinomyces sp.]